MQSSNPLNTMRQWLAEHTASEQPPFSFSYGGKPSAQLWPIWQFEAAEQRLDDRRTEHRLVFTDPTTGLEVRLLAVEYHDFPVVDWTIYLKNTGRTATPILSDIQAIDAIFSVGEEVRLHHHKGDNCTPDSYQPLVTQLDAGASVRLAPTGGRPTQTGFPYFNLERTGEAPGGVIVVLGWPGQWAIEFSRTAPGTVSARGGQETTHFRLQPGEEARTPRVVLMFWEGERSAAQNTWRRWMLAHNAPQLVNGPVPPLLTACAGGFFEGLKCNERDEIRFIDAYKAHDIPLDFWWMDAGWYPCRTWTETGTWEVDRERFPRGLRSISDHAHDQGMGLILWFEPERVAPGTWLAGQSEWLLTAGDGEDLPEWARRWRLLDLGNPEARMWLVDHVDRLMVAEGVDLYRQDFNIDPLPFWRHADAEDRQGLTEIRYVTGYLAYWDELIRRHPGMLIDSCASGGRRNDIETLRRAVPLLRSDYQSFAGDPAYATGNQGHTYALASWIPYFGQGVYFNPQDFAYSARSSLSPGFGIAVDVRREDIDWAAVRQAAGDWQRAAPYMLSDFHPLTAYTLDENTWVAWQFHDPATGSGIVQAFRRKDALTDGACFPLRGLTAEAHYSVTDLDGGEPVEYSGQTLTQQGLPVTLNTRPAAAILLYKRTAQGASA